MTDLVQALTHLAEEQPDTAEAARRVELERALRLLERGIEPAQVFEEMSRRLMNKLLHAPTKALLNDA